MSREVDISLWEPLSTLRDEGLEDLIAAHYDEVGVHKDKMPLAVDWEKYHVLETQGILRLVAARSGDALVGYASFMVMPHLHYSGTVHALNDAVYMRPTHRGAGIRMVREAEKRLARDVSPNWVRIMYHIKLAVEADRGTLGRVFDRLGYSAFETCFDKMVRA